MSSEDVAFLLLMLIGFILVVELVMLVPITLSWFIEGVFAYV